MKKILIKDMLIMKLNQVKIFVRTN